MSAEADAAWVAAQMADDEELGGGRTDSEAVDLDENTGAEVETETADNEPEASGKRSIKARYIGLAVGGAAVVLAASALLYAGGSQPDHKVAHDVAEPAAVVKPGPSTATTPSRLSDRPLPYTADAAGSCPAGSTSAQTMDGGDPRNAFVCVRDGVDGQVINIELPKAYVITAIVLTPGWVGKDASGVEQWSQHRVVTIAQYTFNDDARTLMTQETQNIHGDKPMAVKGVIASRVTMLIRQTSRPPAQPQSTGPTPSGGLDLLLGQPSSPPPSTGPTDAPLFGQPANSDPVDATFAISKLEIIGHEAV
ncbi:MAG: hypothetical protein JOZ49_00155 [Mycolicibacterium sp.]|nr:hypothetical protein [Mycolicibacterium sp.]